MHLETGWVQLPDLHVESEILNEVLLPISLRTSDSRRMLRAVSWTQLPGVRDGHPEIVQEY